ncbi:hypothetical protein L292_1707 [Acinetobacter junii CIP 107470 = MTCC 11364]|uniref:Uncharacterized protein n=1 Tax=Acinetobacter junii CIP 107470 = MTCC 11364 TaxID=1217666 RepID=S7WBE7_ACIJU|nr:hypothetical protein F953_00376 [Acinetobacter junii CIP 107470 = MTCC 11364]EPR80261.1 hypothetical protein L292_1707 [Acinetobacter junii CIP 107470 = MTCC 11364]
MTHKKLENLYDYNGNEKFLSEIEAHKTLYISICLYLYIFFILSFYILSKDHYIEYNILNQYIKLNIGQSNTFFNDLKNASLYLFAAQATLIGLIFPIVIAYVSLANVGRASSDKLMNIYKKHTGFKLLATSSFLLLASYAFLFILDSFFTILLFKISQFLFLIWFVFNLYLIYIFLSKTIDFIYGSKKINEITKYAYNHKKGVRDGFSIISDELSYFLENKNISRAQELEMDLVDFLQTNYTKHSFTNDDMSFFLDEIRKIIDNTMDYNNPHSIKKILYIYYYLGGRLSKINQGVFLDKLLEMHYVVLFDLNNKLNISNDYKDYVYSIFLTSWDSWNSWKNLLKTNQTLNHYSIWLWHICMLTTSARPSESFPPNLDYIDLDNQLMAVADKEQRYSGTIGRYLPFNNFLHDEIQHYLKYLKHFLHLTKAYLSQEQVQAIQEVFDGERLLLLFYDSKGYVRNLELSDIQKYCTEIALQRNWTRHFARYFFAQYCNEDLIKGIFGHDEAMQELFDRYSGFETTDYDQIRAAQDKLIEILELKSMSTFNGIMIK